MRRASYELSPLNREEDLSLPRRHGRCIIRHDSTFKATWDWFVLALVIYIAIETPYSASFQMRPANVNIAVWDRIAQAQPLELVNLLIDIMFLVDIGINFRTTYVEKATEKTIAAPKKIAINYMKSWFVIDFLAGVPFDYILSGTVNELATMAGLLKTARLLRLVRVSRKLDRYSEYGFAVVFLLTSLLCLMSHWMACAWHAIGARELNNPHSWLVLLGKQFNQPINTSEPDSGPKPGMRYVTSLYFVLTSLTSIGFGNVAPNTYAEKIFSVVTMLVGAFFYGVIFGNLTAIIQRLYSSSAHTVQHLRVIKEFTENHELPVELQTMLSEYISEDQTLPVDEEIKSVLPRLPESLQADIQVLLHKELFTKFQVEFKAVSDSSRRALVMKMKTEHLLKGHYLLREGDQVDRMYFIVSGRVRSTRGGMHDNLIDDHGIVGWHPKFSNSMKSTCTLEAQMATDVFLLNCEDVLTLAATYSDLGDLFVSLPYSVTSDAPIAEDQNHVQKAPIADSQGPSRNPEAIQLVPVPAPHSAILSRDVDGNNLDRLEKRINSLEQNVQEILLLLRQQTIKQNTVV